MYRVAAPGSVGLGLAAKVAAIGDGGASDAGGRAGPAVPGSDGGLRWGKTGCAAICRRSSTPYSDGAGVFANSFMMRGSSGWTAGRRLGGDALMDGRLARSQSVNVFSPTRDR